MLYSKQVIIGEDNKDGFIQSAGYIKGAKGFIIKWNGNAEFNDLEVRNGAIFDSELFAGPLYLSRETPTPVVRTFNAGATASQISQQIGSYKSVTGQYNSVNIKAIRVNTQTQNPTGDSLVIYWSITTISVYAVYENGNEVLLAQNISEYKVTMDYIIAGAFPNFSYIPNLQYYNNSQDLVKLQYPIWFMFNMTGFTMKLLNIPDSQPTETGTVWREGDTLKIV